MSTCEVAIVKIFISLRRPCEMPPWPPHLTDGAANPLPAITLVIALVKRRLAVIDVTDRPDVYVAGPLKL
jgi:hypothetical protein